MLLRVRKMFTTKKIGLQTLDCTGFSLHPESIHDIYKYMYTSFESMYRAQSAHLIACFLYFCGTCITEASFNREWSYKVTCIRHICTTWQKNWKDYFRISLVYKQKKIKAKLITHSFASLFIV